MSPLAAGRKEEWRRAVGKTKPVARKAGSSGGWPRRRIRWKGDLDAMKALVKVTSDKRFTEDSSADTQDALSEKRKERDELRTALVKDLEYRSFLGGILLYGGQEIGLDGLTDLKDPIRTALQVLIPNIFPKFAIADHPYDFAKQLKALLNPATADLHKIAPLLGFFDTQGNLQRESPLVAQTLEVLSDLEDQGIVPEGAAPRRERRERIQGYCALALRLARRAIPPRTRRLLPRWRYIYRNADSLRGVDPLRLQWQRRASLEDHEL